VADEVRSLAIRASEASRNTAALIEESVQKAETGVKLNESVTRRLEEIRTGVQRAATIMNNIAEGAVEQEKELAEVTGAMSQISGLTQRTAANAEESASAAAELSAQAAEMQELAAQFELGERHAVARSVSRDVQREVVNREYQRDAQREASREAAPRSAASATARKRTPAKVAAKAAAPARTARPAGKARAATAESDDVFPVSASAVIPFDDEGGDDILGTF